MNIAKAAALAALIISLLPFRADALDGAWSGRLSLGIQKLPLVFNFSESADGTTECAIDSPAQNATGIPAKVTRCTADSVVVDCPSIGASFAGRISNGKISGQFTQRGIALPLKLTPAAPAEDTRPQTPRPPYPYQVVDTSLTAPDGAVMSATLTLPAHAGKRVPAVVMVTGSGPQNRDEEIFGHKPFAVIADYLARNGVASLRYDDRGTGKSGGDFASSTTHTFKADAESAADFLRRYPGIGKVGVLGHSEGGTIALMLGSGKRADFIITLAGMAVSGKATLLDQNSRQLDKSGIKGAEKESTLEALALFFDEIASQARKGVSEPIDIDSLTAARGINVPRAMAGQLAAAQKQRTPWFDTFLTLDPEATLGKIKCPVLAINGDKDTQVDAEANLAAIKRMARHPEIHRPEGLNHLMQHAETGDAAEYAKIRETMAPEVLEIILGFIKKQ